MENILCALISHRRWGSSELVATVEEGWMGWSHLKGGEWERTAQGSLPMGISGAQDNTFQFEPRKRKILCCWDSKQFRREKGLWSLESLQCRKNKITITLGVRSSGHQFELQETGKLKGKSTAKRAVIFLEQKYVLLGSLVLLYSFSFFYSVFLGLHRLHMEVPRLGVELEL